MVRAQQRERLATSDHPGDHPVVGSRQQRLQRGAGGPARANGRDSRSAAPRPHDAAGPEIVAPHGGHWNFGAVTAEPPGDPQERDAELRAHAALRRPGEPMVGGEWRPYFEQRFAADFSDVRVHDLDQEAATLHVALRSGAFYIGALGSTRTHKRREDQLIKSGFSEIDLSRIKAPIGVFGPTRDASSLALSVLADVAATRLMVYA